MDSDSDYERELPDTTPSSPVETDSCYLLAQKVEEFQRMHQLEAIERLTIENTTLQNDIVNYQKLWCSTIELLEVAHQALQSLERAFGDCIDEDIAAEKDWLAFWGIKKEYRCQNYSPAGWI
jgi:hypothetical protein